ncbi:hypothetical protein GTO85_04895 [Lactobacillus crispatus]|uniref:Uncharacterized protein n=1 Tax=Lactobacillus crispatus TaxID=47770 RepID=A0A7H9ECT3_9LACO|nr:hypothetical protein GTO85_04895 [Lactobacillus crispatus]
MKTYFAISSVWSFFIKTKICSLFIV